jgi:hypothetical protein
MSRILSLFIVIILLPAILLADDAKAVDDIQMSSGDIDTAYKIIKVLSIMNVGDPDTIKSADEDSLLVLAQKENADALIFVGHKYSPIFKSMLLKDTIDENDKHELIFSDAIAVKYLNSQEIEKRAKKSKKPPVLKKDGPLDPAPTIVKDKDTDYPYKVIGILDLNPYMANPLANISKAAIRRQAAKEGWNEGADAVIFLKYGKASAVGAMVKLQDAWPEPWKKSNDR